MIFIDGFFLVNFVPFAVLTVVGVMLFFRAGDKFARYYYPLLFVIVTLAYISLWRLGLPLLSRRYAMPTLVPGIIISVFAIILLPGILRYFKVKYANALVRTAIVILLVVCIAKTMREQEHKTYLREIPEVIKADCAKYNSKKAALLVLGNPGGILDCDKMVNVINVTNKTIRGKFADPEYQFNLLKATMDPESLKIKYSHIYLLCVEEKYGSFRAAWEKYYGDVPELLFEYVNIKHQIAYRLYRVSSHYQTAWYSEQEFNTFLEKHNILENGDFSRKVKVLPENPAIQILKQRGIDLSVSNNIYFPASWDINPNAGWQKNCMPAGIEVKTKQDGRNILTMHSMATISLFSNTQIPGRQKYLLFISRAEVQNAIVSVLEFQYADSKYLRHNTILSIKPEIRNMLNAGFLDLSGLNGYASIAIYLSSGFASIEKIYVIPMSAIKPVK